MSPKLRRLTLCLVLALTPASGAFAAAAKTYQVTGPVIALTPSTITVQKGDETWEIARDADAKAEPALKVGDKVTIQYRMQATKVEVKGKADDAKKTEDTSATAKKKKGA